LFFLGRTATAVLELEEEELDEDELLEEPCTWTES
jgi:hypothetical protein